MRRTQEEQQQWDKSFTAIITFSKACVLGHYYCVCVFNSRKQEERTKWSPTDHYPSRLHIFSVISVIYIVMWNDLIVIRLDYEIIPNEKIRYQHFYGKYNYQIQTLEYRQGQFEMYFIFYFVIRFVISLFSTSSHLKMTVKMIFPLLQHGRNVSLIFTWQRHIWVWTPSFWIRQLKNRILKSISEV